MLLKTYHKIISDLEEDLRARRNASREIGDLCIDISPEFNGTIKITLIQGWSPVKHSLEVELNKFGKSRIIIYNDQDESQTIMETNHKIVLEDLKKGRSALFKKSNSAIAYQLSTDNILFKSSLDDYVFSSYENAMNYLHRELLKRFTDPDFPNSDLYQKRREYRNIGKELRKYFPEDLLDLILEYQFK